MGHLLWQVIEEMYGRFVLLFGLLEAPQLIPVCLEGSKVELLRLKEILRLSLDFFIVH